MMVPGHPNTLQSNMCCGWTDNLVSIFPTCVCPTKQTHRQVLGTCSRHLLVSALSLSRAWRLCMQVLSNNCIPLVHKIVVVITRCNSPCFTSACETSQIALCYLWGIRDNRSRRVESRKWFLCMVYMYMYMSSTV